jgi:hypothetical protein
MKWSPSSKAMPLKLIMEGQAAAERGETGLSPGYSKVKPGLHLVPADPEHEDSVAGGTSVTEVPFLASGS